MFLSDFRYATRQLWHAKAFTSIAVLTLAIGVGVTTTFYAIEDAAIFRPARDAHREHLYSLGIGEKRLGVPMDLTKTQFRALEAHLPPGVERVAAVGGWDTVAKINGRTESLRGHVVTGGAGRTFNVPIEAGRFIGPDDDQIDAAPVAVISDAIWRDWFGGRSDVAGRTTMLLDAVHPFTVVGITTPGASVVFPFWQADIWIPAATRPTRSGYVSRLVWRETDMGKAWVRLRPGTPIDQAKSGIRRVLDTSPDGIEPLITKFKLPVDPSAARIEMSPVRADDQSLAITLLLLSVFVLLAACANLANMLYARGARRMGEIAVRLSLGATAGQIFRLFLFEAGIIAVLGSGLGLIFALSATQLIGAASPIAQWGDQSDTLNLSLDARVYLYAAGCGLLAALLVGGLSAWRASRVAPLRVLASAGAAAGITPRRGFARTAFVAIQVSAALILVMATGVYVARTAKALDRHLQFDTAPLASARLDLSPSFSTSSYLHAYSESSARVLYDQVMETVVQLAGVQRVAVTSGLPGTERGQALQLILADKDSSVTDGDSPRPWADSTYRRVNGQISTGSVDFLGTIGLPLSRGRDFRSVDADGAPLVAIVSESAARKLWPGRDPIGRRLMFGIDSEWARQADKWTPNKWWTVIGVCADPISQWVESELESPSNFVLVPFSQRFNASSLVVVRSTAPAAASHMLRLAVYAIGEDVPVSEVGTVDESILRWVRPLRAWGLLMSSLVGISLCIAGLGIYSVISYFVSVRTREFGIRLALGAAPRELVFMAVREARLLLLIGLVPGVLIVSVGSRYFQNTTVAIFTPNDIPTWFAVPTLILCVGLIAAYIPARRAARVDPNVALRMH